MIDRDEFLRLLLTHERDLRAFLGALVADRHAREDLFQETALVLWQQCERYDPARPFGAWARGVAAHRVLQARERGARLPVPFAPETIEAVAAAFDRTAPEASPRTEALAACLDELPARSRELLVLRYERDERPPAIAERLGRTLDAVYQALSRIRQALEECIRHRLAVEAGEV